MLRPIRDLRHLVINIKEYQNVNQSSIAKPSGVRDWYFVPAMNMVGACRFIGYEGMDWNQYDDKNVFVDGGEAKGYLESTRWFRKIGKDEPAYESAMDLASELSPSGKVCKIAKFYILKDEYDKEIKSML